MGCLLFMAQGRSKPVPQTTGRLMQLPVSAALGQRKPIPAPALFYVMQRSVTLPTLMFDTPIN